MDSNNQSGSSNAANALQAVGIAQGNGLQLDASFTQDQQQDQQQLSQNQFYQQVEQVQRQHQSQQQQQQQLLNVNFAQHLAQSLPQSAINQVVPLNAHFQASAPRSDFATREELIEYIHQYARENGFGIVISHSNEKAIYFTCELGGNYRNKRNINDKERKRKLTTRKINCPFAMVANCKRNDQDEVLKWVLRISQNEHNHDKLNLNESFPMLRRRNPEINRAIRELYLKGQKPLTIEKLLKDKFKNILINREDIYNETRKMKREEKLKGNNLLHQDQIPVELAQDTNQIKDDVFDQNIPALLHVIPMNFSSNLQSSDNHQDQNPQQDQQQSSQQLQNQINQAQYNLQQVNQAIANAQQNPPKPDPTLSNIDINLVKHQGLMR